MKEPFGFTKYNSDHDSGSDWVPCKVLSYDPDTSLFLIEIEVPKIRKHVPRFNHRFNKEDQEKFNERIEVAQMNARRFEISIRFETRVSQMSTKELPEPPEEVVERINKLVKFPDQTTIFMLFDEVTLSFKTNNNRIYFIHSLMYNPHIEDRDEMLEFVLEKPEEKSSNLIIRNPSMKPNLEFLQKNCLFTSVSFYRGILSVWKFLGDLEDFDIFPFVFSGPSILSISLKQRKIRFLICYPI
jgi:hypothetical protein